MKAERNERRIGTSRWDEKKRYPLLAHCWVCEPLPNGFSVWHLTSDVRRRPLPNSLNFRRRLIWLFSEYVPLVPVDRGGTGQRVFGLVCEGTSETPRGKRGDRLAGVRMHSLFLLRCSSVMTEYGIPRLQGWTNSWLPRDPKKTTAIKFSERDKCRRNPLWLLDG